jgi:hypothetical protein
VQTLKNDGRKVLCYFSAGSLEPGRVDANAYPSNVIGNSVSGGESGEKWLDVSSQTVRTLMAARMDRAAQKGCDGIDPARVDEYTHDSGFDAINSTMQQDYNLYLVAQAHARGLVIGLRNDLNQAAALEASFDFAVVEDCVHDRTCSQEAAFVTAGKAVLDIEYGTSSRSCGTAPGIMQLVKDTLLDSFRIACN